jgi:hypothetical protein
VRRKTFATPYRILIILLTCALLLLNLRLYHSAITGYTTASLGPDVLPQLRFLGNALRNGAGDKMQRQFPEGFFFTHVLYGLAWVEVGFRQPSDSALQQQALAEAAWALERLDSPIGKAPFSAVGRLSYGIFHAGWSAWLRGGILKLQLPGEHEQETLGRFVGDCIEIARAFEQSSTPFLAAYPGGAWPVDSVVAIATLRLHDTLLPARFQPTITNWLRAAQARLDPATGLLPHRVDPITGQTVEGARGSSQSLIGRFLTEIDAGWGYEQYARFRNLFVATPLGIPGVREYPVGVAGQGDVDSGPLILGLSPSATVVTAGTAMRNGDPALAFPLLDLLETAGLPLHWDGAKRYIIGQLPVLDAFLVWAKTATAWTGGSNNALFPSVVRWWWRLPFHAVSLIVMTMLWFPFRTRRVADSTAPRT